MNERELGDETLIEPEKDTPCRAEQVIIFSQGMDSERTRGADSTASQLGKALLVSKRITSESLVTRSEW